MKSDRSARRLRRGLCHEHCAAVCAGLVEVPGPAAGVRRRGLRDPARRG
jgi:hypothetical protein